MKMKSRILMAVVAVFFMLSGSAFAIPFVDVTAAGNVLTYDVTNDLAGFDIYGVGFGATALSVDGSWVLPAGVAFSTTNGYDVFTVNPYADTVSGIQITYSAVPDAIDTVIYVLGQSAYLGDGATFIGQRNGNYYYKFYGTTSVPEPATMLMLGLGLLGVAGMRKKLRK